MGIRGFCFAWIANETDAFDPVAHRRKDLPIVGIDVGEEENVDAHVATIVCAAFPTAQLQGKQWGILSFEHPDGTLRPIARIRRRPRPVVERRGYLTVEFNALPSEWQTLRDDGLAPMKVLPFYDELTIDISRRNDPVEILDGYRVAQHFDRVTQAFTTPELLGVGLPVKVLGKKDLVGDKSGGGIKVRQTQAPLAGVQCNWSADWTQADDGPIDMTQALLAAFGDGSVGDPSVGGPSSSKQVPHGVVSTLTPESLEGSWPSKDTGIGGASGYSIIASTLNKIPAPDGAATRTGICRGQRARYDYTKDKDLKTPIGLGFEITYYAATLALWYSLRQRRQERVGFFVGNANVAYADGAVETISQSVQDPTLDTSTQPYLPNQNVAVGDRRRVGIYCWAANRAHVTRGNFSQDLYAADGHEQWDLLGVTGAPAGTSNLPSFAQTARGTASIANLAYKAIKKISLSQRCVEVKFTVLLEDWVDVSTAWACQISGVEDPLLPGGTAFGKVTSIRISKNGPTDYPKVAVTMLCCDGNGVAGPDQAHGLNPSGQPWDGITLSSPAAAQIPATPVPGGLVVIENAPQEQVTYIQANDFTGEAPRNDRTLNDPKHLLGQVKTKAIISCNPINGQPPLVTDIALAASAWGGPAQVSSAGY